jgi:hypothetical protein
MADKLRSDLIESENSEEIIRALSLVKSEVRKLQDEMNAIKKEQAMALLEAQKMLSGVGSSLVQMAAAQEKKQRQLYHEQADRAEMIDTAIQLPQNTSKIVQAGIRQRKHAKSQVCNNSSMFVRAKLYIFCLHRLKKVPPIHGIKRLWEKQRPHNWRRRSFKIEGKT